MVNLELPVKFTRWKKKRESHDNESSGESIWGAALIRGRGFSTFLSQMRRLFEGGAYSSKYGKHKQKKVHTCYISTREETYTSAVCSNVYAAPGLHSCKRDISISVIKWKRLLFLKLMSLPAYSAFAHAYVYLCHSVGFTTNRRYHQCLVWKRGTWRPLTLLWTVMMAAFFSWHLFTLH